MKIAAYTHDTIWAVEPTEGEARVEAEATMNETGDSGRIGELKFAPIDDALCDALEQAEGAGTEVLFELIDGELCEVVEAA